MRKSHYVSAAVSAALCISLNVSSVAAADTSAPLATGLRELAAAYDRGDPRLPQKLKLHLTDRAGDPIVKVRLMPGADADAVLAKLSAAGFRLQTRSTIDTSIVEGYLPLAFAHKAAARSGCALDPCRAPAHAACRLGAEPGRGAAESGYCAKEWL